MSTTPAPADAVPIFPVPVAIALGSNLGARLANLRRAVGALSSRVEVRKCSAVYESEPMYVESQPPFLNACCVGETGLTARGLLRMLQELEREAGRVGGGCRFGPRELDLDLLLYGDSVIREEGLWVPHPGMPERPFVLWPLAEIAGDWLHPETGRPITLMAERLPRDTLRLFAPPVTLAGMD